MSRIKAKSLTTREEFNASVATAADKETMIRFIEAKRDRLIQRVQARYGALLAPLVTERDAQIALAEKYADDNRKELLPKDRKSVEMPTAKFGWREGNRTVQVLQKLKSDVVVAKLKALGLASYVRTTEEIAKDKILADCRNGKTIALPPAKEGARKKHIAIARASLRISQAETFYVEPKVESAETIKPVEATAAA